MSGPRRLYFGVTHGATVNHSPPLSFSIQMSIRRHMEDAFLGRVSLLPNTVVINIESYFQHNFHCPQDTDGDLRKMIPEEQSPVLRTYILLATDTTILILSIALLEYWSVA